MASSIVFSGERQVSTDTRDHSGEDVLDALRSDAVLSQLNDDVNRCFLNLMSRKWRTAQELTDICETPLSTTYRKLNALVDAGFLEQRIRVNDTGKHPEEYKSKPMVLTFRITEPSGIEVSVHTVSEAGEDRFQ